MYNYSFSINYCNINCTEIVYEVVECSLYCRSSFEKNYEDMTINNANISNKLFVGNKCV